MREKEKKKEGNRIEKNTDKTEKDREKLTIKRENKQSRKKNVITKGEKLKSICRVLFLT